MMYLRQIMDKTVIFFRGQKVKKSVAAKIAKLVVNSQFVWRHIMQALYSGFRVNNEQHLFTT